MKKTFSEEIIIDAPMRIVWQTLVDFPAYPEWNPFLTGVEGFAETGRRIGLTFRLPDGKTQRFDARVAECDPPRELHWKGKLLVGGLYDGEHFFVLRDLSPTRTKLLHCKKYSGLLAGLYAKSLDQNIPEGFRQMNEALKTRAEQLAKNL